MNGRRIQFSIGNLMLMMVPLGVVFWFARQASEERWLVWLVALSIGIWPAIGALMGGWKGMGQGLVWFVRMYLVSAAIGGLVLLLAMCIQAVSGVDVSGPQVWSVGVAALLLGIGPAIGAARGAWPGVRIWSVGWSVFVTVCMMIAVYVIAIVRAIGGR